MTTVVNEFVRFVHLAPAETLARTGEALRRVGFAAETHGGDHLVASRGERPAPTPDLVPLRVEAWVVADGDGAVLRLRAADGAANVLTGPVRRNYERLVHQLELDVDAALAEASSGLSPTR